MYYLDKHKYVYIHLLFIGQSRYVARILSILCVYILEKKIIMQNLLFTKIIKIIKSNKKQFFFL